MGPSSTPEPAVLERTNQAFSTCRIWGKISREREGRRAEGRRKGGGDKAAGATAASQPEPAQTGNSHVSSPNREPGAPCTLVALAKYPTEWRARGHKGPQASKTGMRKSTLPSQDPTPAAQGADPRMERNLPEVSLTSRYYAQGLHHPGVCF